MVLRFYVCQIVRHVAQTMKEEVHLALIYAPWDMMNVPEIVNIIRNDFKIIDILNRF